MEKLILKLVGVAAALVCFVILMSAFAGYVIGFVISGLGTIIALIGFLSGGGSKCLVALAAYGSTFAVLVFLGQKFRIWLTPKPTQ
jgi:hypothetical protein